MALNLSKAVLECLQTQPGERLTARQIAEWIDQTFPGETREKQERTAIATKAGLIQQLAGEIGSQRPILEKRFPQIKTTDGRPRHYFFSAQTDEAELVAAEILETTNVGQLGYTEHSLYPLLSEFLWRELAIYSRRIDERRGRNGQGAGANRWLYPDLVGLEDLSEGWIDEIKYCVRERADRKTRLWSFEVKKLINRANVREVYFQAVSNSSWANYGYLVSAEIQGAEKELRMLAGLHGIGLIKLDVEAPSESEIIIPARERSHVDWNAANRLAEENPDFLDCIRLVRQFYQTGEHRPGDWDIPGESVT